VELRGAFINEANRKKVVQDWSSLFILFYLIQIYIKLMDLLLIVDSLWGKFTKIVVTQILLVECHQD